MKKLKTISLMLLTIGLLSACGQQPNSNNNNQPISSSKPEIVGNNSIVSNQTAESSSSSEPQPNNVPSNYKDCSSDTDCKLVKSYEPCRQVEAINKTISDQEWNSYGEKLVKDKDALYKCRQPELDLDNAKAVCQDRKCLAVDQETEYAKEGAYCYQGSELKKNQCASGLACINQETGEEAPSWVSGICRKKN